MKIKEYLVDWDVWNAQTEMYEPEGLSDFAYADSPELAIDLMIDHIIENCDDWDIEKDGDVLKLQHERYDRHEDRMIVTNLEYRNFRVRSTE